jgi:hypothetical protein
MIAKEQPAVRSRQSARRGISGSLTGSTAAAEIRKIVDQRRHCSELLDGSVLRILVLLAQRPLESRTSQGADADAARVRALAAYKDFLTLWKDANPEIPHPEAS